MLSIDENRCNLCGQCIPICVPQILQAGEKSIVVGDQNLCIHCGHCKAVCPVDAPQFSENNEEFDPVPRKQEIPHPTSFLRFLRGRRSLRVYQDRPVEKEKLQMIVEAGRCAPSGGNRQAGEYIVVQGRKILDSVCRLAIPFLKTQGEHIQEVLDRSARFHKSIPEEYIPREYLPHLLSQMARRWEKGEDRLLFHAPALILIHSKKNNSSNPDRDIGILSTQMILMAETLGLGTCYIGLLTWAIENSLPLQDLLEIPLEHNVQIAFTVGYPGIEFLRLPARNPAQINWIGDFPGNGRQTRGGKK